MEIYAIGYLLIPLSLFLFIYFPKQLYFLTLFFIPFTGTAVFKISLSGINAEGVRVSMYLASLCFIRYFLLVLYFGKIKIIQAQRPLVGLLVLLVVIACSSLFMPVFINGRLVVLDVYGNLVMYASEKPLYFRLQYFTQTLYFIFGCLLTYYIAVKNPDFSSIYQSFRVYVLGCLFVSFWGWVELTLYVTNIPYPGFLFNHNSMNALGSLVLNGKPRITSVALEPSILSQQLLTVIPVLFWGLIYRQPFFSLHLQKLVLISIILTLLFAWSSTAYLGLFSFVCIIITTFIIQNRVPKKILYALGGLIIIFAIALPLLIEQLLEKLHTYSGIERFKALSFAWNYFIEYPLLGIGWGVMPSWDFVVCILAGTGIIGLLVFSILLAACFYNLKRQFKISYIHQPFLLGISQGLILLLIVSQSSGFIYHSLYFWLMLGFAIATASLRSPT